MGAHQDKHSGVPTLTKEGRWMRGRDLPPCPGKTPPLPPSVGAEPDDDLQLIALRRERDELKARLDASLDKQAEQHKTIVSLREQLLLAPPGLGSVKAYPDDTAPLLASELGSVGVHPDEPALLLAPLALGNVKAHPDEPALLLAPPELGTVEGNPDEPAKLPITGGVGPGAVLSMLAEPAFLCWDLNRRALALDLATGSCAVPLKGFPDERDDSSTGSTACCALGDCGAKHKICWECNDGWNDGNDSEDASLLFLDKLSGSMVQDLW